jgi:hypothetical protein
MKTLLFTFIFIFYSLLSFAQQFQLKATIDTTIAIIFDMDGDGICEYKAYTNKIFDGLTQDLKYILPDGYVEWNDYTKAQNPYSFFLILILIPMGSGT